MGKENPPNTLKLPNLKRLGGHEGSRTNGEDETQNCTSPPGFELFPWGFSDFFFFLLKGQLSCQSPKCQAPSLMRVESCLSHLLNGKRPLVATGMEAEGRGSLPYPDPREKRNNSGTKPPWR